MAIDSQYYVHDMDKAALKALKAIPGFNAFIKAFMKIWSERQFRISNMSSSIRLSEKQLPKYYDMLPPICERLGIAVPDLYLQLDVNPNAYTYGDTEPFVVLTSGMLETVPDELIPTVLAHECGHIACHHVLYRTMGNLLLSGAISMMKSFIPYGSLISMPLEIAFFQWMRCSELSADRAAVLCDGSADKMAELCMRLAGYDKDVAAIASTEEFMAQAREYRAMIMDSKWNKTLEFMALRRMDHPLMTVRALECTEWGMSDKFYDLMKGITPARSRRKSAEEAAAERVTGSIEDDLPAEGVSAADELRKFKALLDEGIITQQEFNRKKKQLLG